MPRIPSAPTERSHTGYALVLGLVGRTRPVVHGAEDFDQAGKQFLVHFQTVGVVAVGPVENRSRGNPEHRKLCLPAQPCWMEGNTTFRKTTDDERRVRNSDRAVVASPQPSPPVISAVVDDVGVSGNAGMCRERGVIRRMGVVSPQGSGPLAGAIKRSYWHWRQCLRRRPVLKADR